MWHRLSTVILQRYEDAFLRKDNKNNDFIRHFRLYFTCGRAFMTVPGAWRRRCWPRSGLMMLNTIRHGTCVQRHHARSGAGSAPALPHACVMVLSWTQRGRSVSFPSQGTMVTCIRWVSLLREHELCHLAVAIGNKILGMHRLTGQRSEPAGFCL